MYQLRVAVVRISKAVAAGIAKALKLLKKYSKKTMGFLFGSNSGGVAMDGPDMEADEADTPEAEGMEPQETFALDRKQKGLEPQDIKTFALEQDEAKRKKFADKHFTAKTRQWCLDLDAPQRAILATAHAKAIEAHMAGVRNISGVTMAPRMFGTHRPDIARQMSNDLKNDGKATDLVFHAKELARLEKPLPKSTGAKAFGKREMPTPSGGLKFRSMSAKYAYNTPKPPYAMFAAAGRAA